MTQDGQSFKGLQIAPPKEPVAIDQGKITGKGGLWEWTHLAAQPENPDCQVFT